MMILRLLVLVPLLITLCHTSAHARAAPTNTPVAPATATGSQAATNKQPEPPATPVPEASRGAPQQTPNQPAQSSPPATPPGSPSGAASTHSAPAGQAPAPPAGQNTKVPPGQGTTAPAASAAVYGAATSAESHVLRLRDLEARIDELKEEIRRSHARLSLLSETLLSGGLGGARADIVFRNDTSNAFRVVRVMVILDGTVQYKKQDDTGELSKQREIPVFSGPVPPGDHTLQIVVGLQGHGYGVFSYLKAFKPEVKLTRSFTVEEGKAIRLELTAWEKGGATTPLEQRPAIRVTEKLMDRREAELSESQ